jgi:hypothetical protein
VSRSNLRDVSQQIARQWSELSEFNKKQMISALFWDITQRRVVVPYRRFGTTYRSHLQGPSSFSGTVCPAKRGPIGCPETSVQNFHSALRNIPEECRYHLSRGGSLRSRIDKNRFFRFFVRWYRKLFISEYDI